MDNDCLKEQSRMIAKELSWLDKNLEVERCSECGYIGCNGECKIGGGRGGC